MTLSNKLKITVVIIIAFILKVSYGLCQPTKHIVLISIDGLHPDMYLDKNWPTPNLQFVMKKGVYADHCLSVFPAYTYPSHAAMLTGALPARSKITYNQPINDYSGNWNWYSFNIKSPTVWQAMHKARLTTAAIMWPGTVGADIDYNLSEIWNKDHPDDRATEVRNHGTKGLFDEVVANATGKLDSTNMNDNYFSLDENSSRIASYIFKKYKPNFMAVHFACVDSEEHEYGRNGDSVRLAIAANDHAVGNILEAIKQSNMTDSTTVIITGDHGFSTICTIMRPNLLIKGIKGKFIAAGGACFLYRAEGALKGDEPSIVKAVTNRLSKLPKEKQQLFSVIYRKELNRMGADSTAILALAAVPGMVFSGSTIAAKTINRGPGTLIQNNNLEGVFIATKGGHHGYDPNIPDMWTGFIATGVGINKGQHINEMAVVNIAPLIAKLLGVDFKAPDGHLVPGILTN